MTESDLGTGTHLPSDSSSRNPFRSTSSASSTDLWLNLSMWALVVLLVGGAAYFGYRVYRDSIAEDQSSATGRVAAALGAQVRANPNDAVLRVRYGEALGAMGKYQQAIDQFNAALKIDPKHDGAMLDLGMVAQLTQNYDAAVGYYQKVISLTDSQQYSQLNPTREQAFYNLGLIALQRKQYADAAGYFKASIRIRNDASDTYYNLAKAYQGLGDPDAAISELETALQFDPGFAEAHFFLGQLYQGKKDDVNASYQYAQAVKYAPGADPPKQALDAYGTAQDWITKASQALSSGDIENALNDVLVARNLDENSFAAAMLHGQILVERGNLSDALQVYRQAAQLNPNDAGVKATIAKLAAQVKKLTPKKSAAIKKAAAKKAAAKKAATQKAATQKAKTTAAAPAATTGGK